MKIAFVTPWYGPDIPGGSEAEARRTIEKLQQSGVDEMLARDSEGGVELDVIRTGRKTVPQIFIGDQHIGGFDDLVKWDQSGKLKPE